MARLLLVQVSLAVATSKKCTANQGTVMLQVGILSNSESKLL